MYCVKCGAPIKEGARFCCRCGAGVKARSGGGHGLSSPAFTALLLLLALCGALLVFRAGSAPRRDSPKGTLDILMSAFAVKDRTAAAACLAVEEDADRVMDWMEDADGGSQLLFNLVKDHDGGNALKDIQRLLRGFRKLEIITVSVNWSRSYNDAQSLSALLRVTPRTGEAYTLSLTNLNFTCRDGSWYLK